MLKKLLAGATTVLVALGIVTLTAIPASAHDAVVTAAVSCNSATSATITWSVKNNWSTGSTISKVTGNASPTPTPLGDQYKKNETKTYTQAVSKSDVGTTFTLGIEMTWPDGTVNGGSQSVGSITIASSNFSCGDTTNQKVRICHATASASNPWVSESPSASSILTGLGGHGSSGVNVDDIIPPFNYIEGGVDKTYPGNNWDAVHQLIYNNDCAPVPANPSVPTFVNAVCTAAGQVGTGAVTIPSGPVGVSYRYSTDGVHFINATPGTTIPIAVGLTVTVQAYAQPGYTIPANQPTSWSQKITSPVADHCVVTTVPTWTDSVCTAIPGSSSQASYTIPSTTGVVYFVNGVQKPAGTYKVDAFPTAITITAQAASGYTFPAGTTASWPTFTFHGPGDCRVLATPSVTFTPSICTGPGASTSPSFTLGTDTNVVYTVMINGQASSDNVPGTTYVVGKSDSVSVDAVPANGYRFSPDQPFHQDVTFVEKQCLVDAGVATAAPTSTPTVCNADVAGGKTLATYTLLAADNISWTVSTDHSTYTPQAVGTYDIPEGTSVWVRAVADPGFQIIGDSDFGPFVSADLGTSCEKSVDYTQPTATDAICTEGDQTPGSYTLAAVDHVTYDVWVNGTLTEDVDPGTYSAEPGDSVFVVATTDQGWNFGEGGDYTETWGFDFVNDGLCAATPVAPQITDQTCTVNPNGSGSYTNGSIDIPATAGVKYTLDGEGVTAGTHVVTPGQHTVAAMALTGYKLSDYDGPWTVTSAAAPSCGQLVTEALVDPMVSSPTCAAPTTFTLGNDLGIVDAVNWTIDGKPAAAGSHTVPAGTSVAVHAEPASEFGFAFDQQKDWTVTASDAASCGQLKTLALTGGALPVGMIGAAGLLLLVGLSMVGVQLAGRRRREQD